MHRAALSILRKVNHKGAVGTSSYGSRYLQRDAGFSLVEVVAVVLMIGILAAIAAPGWLAFVNRQQLNKANDAVLAAIQDAQIKAKKQKISYSVSFRTNNSIPQIAVNQGATPSNWSDLGKDLGIKPGQVLLYTNLDAANTKNASGNIAVSAPGTGTITFDYMGVLAPKASGNNLTADTDLKVMVAIPNSGTTQASGLRRCVIVETIIGGMRTAKDGLCN